VSSRNDLLKPGILRTRKGPRGARRGNPFAAGTSRPAGKSPDWNAVEWWVYSGQPRADGSPTYRVVTGQLSAGERSAATTLLATVKRCSRKAVLDLLDRGVRPALVQRHVDHAAAAQVLRSAEGPNAYRELCDRLAEERRKSRESTAAADRPDPFVEAMRALARPA
jgi:hypothetical protein